MEIKAVAFDLGQTLVYYDNPLDWQSLYPPAIRQVMAACGLACTEQADESARRVLSKYNTRVNYREYEVSSDVIFSELLDSWRVSHDKLQAAKGAFYGFFQRGAACYGDAGYVLRTLIGRGIKTGVLTDVAYGMDNEYALRDMAPLMEYIGVCLTSNDVGFRKPNSEGYLALQKSFGADMSRIAFVGDEDKDISGANNAGMLSILIDRGDKPKNFSQDYTVKSLTEILGIIIS